MLEILTGVVVAVIFFLVAYKIIRPNSQKDKTPHYVCDVCKGTVCECRKVDEKDT